MQEVNTVGALIIALQSLLIVAFVASGTLKLVPGDNGSKRNYAKLRLPGWWLAPIGAVEVAAALCLFAGFWSPLGAGIGAVLMVATMLGAVASHVVQDARFAGYPALVLLVGSAAFLALRVQMWA